MHFLPELEEFLQDHGEIYTVRKYLYPIKVCLVYINDSWESYKRRYIKEIHDIKDLEPYASLSGLETAGAWWSKIRFINRGLVPSPERPMYLYHITALGR